MRIKRKPEDILRWKEEAAAVSGDTLVTVHSKTVPANTLRGGFTKRER